MSAVAHLSERTLGYVEKIAAAIIKAKRRMFKLVHKNRGGSLFVRILSNGELEPLLFDNLTQRERSLTVHEALGAFLHTPPPRAEKKESKKERTKKRKRR